MLYFTSKDGREKEWHVGNPKPTMFSEVVEVQADGDELGFLISKIINLPHVLPGHKPVQVWRGDMARFIYDNLPR